MKKLFALAAVVLGVIVSLYSVNDAFADRMWAPSVANLSVATPITLSAVDFQYELSDDGQPLSNFTLQYDNNGFFSSPDINAQLTSKSAMDNVNVASTISGSGVTVHWRILYNGTELARSSFVTP